MQTIDYRKTFWGHNISVSPKDGDKWSGFCWHNRGVREGDEMLWETAYGVVRARVIESKNLLDPQDMYKITVDVVGRRVKKSLKEQFEKEKPFEVEEWIDG